MSQTPTREDAWALLTEYTDNPSLLRHALGVEAAMRAYLAWEEQLPAQIAASEKPPVPWISPIFVMLALLKLSRIPVAPVMVPVFTSTALSELFR